MTGRTDRWSTSQRSVLSSHWLWSTCVLSRARNISQKRERNLAIWRKGPSFVREGDERDAVVGVPSKWTTSFFPFFLFSFLWVTQIVSHPSDCCPSFLTIAPLHQLPFPPSLPLSHQKTSCQLWQLSTRPNRSTVSSTIHSPSIPVIFFFFPLLLFCSFSYLF